MINVLVQIPPRVFHVILRTDHQGRTLLHHAAEGHAAKAVQALLKARSTSEHSAPAKRGTPWGSLAPNRNQW